MPTAKVLTHAMLVHQGRLGTLNSTLSAHLLSAEALQLPAAAVQCVHHKRARHLLLVKKLLHDTLPTQHHNNHTGQQAGMGSVQEQLLSCSERRFSLSCPIVQLPD